MAGSKVLVLGGTGPAGICLLRELLHRNHPVVVFARTPSKIPSELASNPLLEVRSSIISLPPPTPSCDNKLTLPRSSKAA